MKSLCPICKAVSVLTLAGTFYCPVCDRWFPAWANKGEGPQKRLLLFFPYPHKITIPFRMKREDLRNVYVTDIFQESG